MNSKVEGLLKSCTKSYSHYLNAARVYNELEAENKKLNDSLDEISKAISTVKSVRINEVKYVIEQPLQFVLHEIRQKLKNTME